MTKFVGITVPKELFDKIESDRNDLPRSYYCRKLMEFAYKAGFKAINWGPCSGD